MTGYLAGLQPPTQGQWGGIAGVFLVVLCVMFLAGARR